jgi:uncharacterized coiled-coil DUF342 family protein
LCSGCAADRITHLYAEWDVSVSQCDEVSRERDEALDRIAHLDAEWDVLAGQLEATESERDEARDEVERLRARVAEVKDEAEACLAYAHELAQKLGEAMGCCMYPLSCLRCSGADPEPGE